MRSMKLRRPVIVAATVLLGTVSMRAPAQEVQEELSEGGLRQYQITTTNRKICWMYSCGWGFCCLVY